MASKILISKSMPLVEILIVLSCVALDVAIATGCSTSGLTLTNGQYNAQDGVIDVGGEISACCNVGFLRKGPQTLTCLSSGLFSEPRPTCVDINECTAPLLPLEEGEGESSSSSSSSAYSHDTGAEDPVVDGDAIPHPLLIADEEQVTCQGGRLLPPNDERCHAYATCSNTEGSFTCRCLDNYIGNGSFCKFDDLPCETLSAPENGYFVYQVSRRLRISCDDGFSLIGCAEQICRRGRWVANIAGSDEECDPVICYDTSIECEPLDAPENGNIIKTGRRWQVGSRVYFSCDAEHSLVGPSERVCQSTGRWTGRRVKCQPPQTLVDIASDIQYNLIDSITPYTNSSLMRRNLARSVNVHSVGLELVLAYDRSASIAISEFEIAVNFTKQLITKFGVSHAEGGTRVAALTFANDALLAFGLDSENADSVEKVFERLDELGTTPRGGTALKEGLELVATDLAGDFRDQAKRILFIFTDGKHNTEDPTALAGDLKTQHDVEIYAVGVGAQIDSDALELLASPSTRTKKHFFHIRNFDDLETLTALVANTEIDYTPCGRTGDVQLEEGLVAENYTTAEKVWPWLSIIHRDTPNSNDTLPWLCSGVLICDEWILTTASCFDEFELIGEQLADKTTFEEISLSVSLGDYDTSLQDGCEQTIPVDRVVSYTEPYDYDHDYDIALLHLSEPADLNSCVRTACLPTETDFEILDCHVVGWKRGGTGLDSEVPLQYPLAPKDNGACRSIFEQRPGRRVSVSDRMTCAGELTHVDSRCNGDVGSPLMCRSVDKWLVRGISTYGEGCSLYGELGVFTTLTSAYVDWIAASTSNCTMSHGREDV